MIESAERETMFKIREKLFRGNMSRRGFSTPLLQTPSIVINIEMKKMIVPQSTPTRMLLESSENM